MAATNNYHGSSRKYPEKDSLFFKFQGHSQESLRETAKSVRRIVEKHGGSGFELARNEKEATDMWTDRKNAHFSGLAFAGKGGKGWSTDVW
jgi:D-lactate dehydrogenase (cytochrome)